VEVERELKGRESEPSELIYFKVYIWPGLGDPRGPRPRFQKQLGMGSRTKLGKLLITQAGSLVELRTAAAGLFVSQNREPEAQHLVFGVTSSTIQIAQNAPATAARR
jgi:hypothetical protein